MSHERQTLNIWTCDVCGHADTVDNAGSGYPMGWFQVAAASLTAQLGNATAKHLCPGCRDTLGRLLNNTLGDTGDLAQAWDEGCIAGSMTEYDGRKANPYREDHS